MIVNKNNEKQQENKKGVRNICDEKLILKKD